MSWLLDHSLVIGIALLIFTSAVVLIRDGMEHDRRKREERRALADAERDRRHRRQFHAPVAPRFYS